MVHSSAFISGYTSIPFIASQALRQIVEPMSYAQKIKELRKRSSGAGTAVAWPEARSKFEFKEKNDEAFAPSRCIELTLKKRLVRKLSSGSGSIERTRMANE